MASTMKNDHLNTGHYCLVFKIHLNNGPLFKQKALENSNNGPDLY